MMAPARYYTHTHTRADAHILTHLHTHTHVCTHTHTYTHLFDGTCKAPRTHPPSLTLSHSHTHTNTNTHTHALTHTYTRTHARAHTHTYTHLVCCKVYTRSLPLLLSCAFLLSRYPYLSRARLPSLFLSKYIDISRYVYMNMRVYVYIHRGLHSALKTDNTRSSRKFAHMYV